MKLLILIIVLLFLGALSFPTPALASICIKERGTIILLYQEGRVTDGFKVDYASVTPTGSCLKRPVISKYSDPTNYIPYWFNHRLWTDDGVYQIDRACDGQDGWSTGCDQFGRIDLLSTDPADFDTLKQEWLHKEKEGESSKFWASVAYALGPTAFFIIAIGWPLLIKKLIKLSNNLMRAIVFLSTIIQGMLLYLYYSSLQYSLTYTKEWGIDNYPVIDITLAACSAMLVVAMVRQSLFVIRGR